MSQVFDTIPQKYPHKILCYYQNSTNKLQTLRVTNIPEWYFEQIVFPGERLLFEAVAEGQLEIYSGGRVVPNLAQVVPCRQLATKENEITESPLVVGFG